MGRFAVQGRLQRVASVQHHGLAELCPAADRAVELQPRDQWRSAGGWRESRTIGGFAVELKIMRAGTTVFAMADLEL